MIRTARRFAAITTAAGLLLVGSATARIPERPDTVSLGRSIAGGPCTATRDWHDAAVPDPFARAYAITCQGVAASHPVGAVRIVPATPDAIKAIDAVLTCGADQPVTISTGPAQARRCFDATLSTETIRIDLTIGSERLIADASPAVLGQLEEAVAILSGAKRASADVSRTVKASFDPASLGPVPAVAPLSAPGAAIKPVETTAAENVAVPSEIVAAADANAFDPAAALAAGINLNHKGLHVEASRVLNDALSRLPATAGAETRAELLLEAGLADSNIRFVDAAHDHFAQADAVLDAHPAARTPFVQRKRDTYHALDALNRQQFDEALTMLDRLARPTVAADQPLQDPATLRLLNQPRSNRADAVSSIAVPNTADLNQLVLDAEANWARSIALLSKGDQVGALAAIDAAANAYRPLQTERIDKSQILWLGARIERQRARLLARGGKIQPALASFDRAIDGMRRGALATAGTGNEPAIADAQLERAAIFARSGAKQSDIRVEYAQAIDSMIDSDSNSLGNSTGMEDYLDLLVAEAKTNERPDTAERFFRAIQATGEPAVARQLSQLKNVVTANPQLGAMVRDRAELQREITRLRYAIAAGSKPGDTPVAELEQARDAAEQRLLRVEAALANDPRFRSVDEQPATLAELRRALRPGEAFLKVSETNRRIYGLFVNADHAYIYAIAANAQAKAVVDQLAKDVRTSIDGHLADNKLVPFDDAKAYVLFRLIGGPAATTLAATQTLVVDPAGPLERLPIGVLVTRYNKGTVRPSTFDFSQTAFLAASTTISTALSPRSFLVARALPPSRATRPFLGLGEHVPPLESGAAGDARMVPIGYGCSINFGQLAALSRRLEPISSQELTSAAEALGDPKAPMMVDAAFTDTNVEARGDLDQFQVLHFATHGLEEGQWGCAKSPPALVTSIGDAGSDGLLSFSEIAGLRLDANLVMLSACDTSSGVKSEELVRLSGQEEAGSTLEGLVRAFLTANARAVVATYWEVSAEKDNLEFIRTFYASARGRTIGGALQDAQRDLMRQPAYSHPFYWAPYFVVGDSTKSMLSTPPAPQVAQR